MVRCLGWAVALGVSMALALGPTATAGEAAAEKPAEGAAAAPAATEPAKAPPIPAARVMPWNSRDEPWHLFPVLPFNVKIYGWLDVGYTHVKLAAPSGFAGVTGPNDRDDRVLMNQAYLVIERVANPGKAGFDFGGRLDLLYGTDARYTEPAGSGLGASWNSQNIYGYDIPQAYLEFAAAAQPLTFRLKAGHFYSPLGGGEALKAPDRFFYSLTYSALYGAPLTSTGALASVSMDLPLGSQITLLGGADRGWNRYHGNPNGNDTAYYTGVQGKTAWGTKGFDTSLSYIYARSNETANPFIPGLKDDATLHSVAFQQQIFRRLNLTAGYCHGEQQNGSPFDGGDARWRGFTQELVYQLNRVWSVGVRHERFRDLDGSRVGQVGYRHKTDPVPPFGFKGAFEATSFGINCKPTANITIRSEVRHDKFDGTSGFGPRPFHDGTQNSQTSYGFDVIFRF